MKKLVYFIFFWAISASCAQAAALSVTVQDARETIAIPVGKTDPRKVFTMSAPDRLVVNVPTLPSRSGVTLPGSYHGALIKKIRAAQFDPKTTRIVFELAAPVKVLDVSVPKKGQLSVTITALGKAPVAAAAKPVSSAALEKPAKREKPLIMIDPGHGGIDPGAHGSGRSFEKDIVLEYAHALKAQLIKQGYRAQMTREGDHFIRLRERVEIARKAGASLFISLHADSAPGTNARGLSLYTLSDEASDKESEALAAHENKADILGGIDLSDERQDVANILISLAQRETKNESALLADFITRSLVDQRVKLLDNPHRFAGFAVLKAPDVPSVLVEIGFLSNREEEKLLRTKSHRLQVAKGIGAAVDKYFALHRDNP